ncbi:MAG: sigma-70 region 4 domain-containing protein [Candidatus Aphodomonas sp.]|nr:sigma-70 region 4 domain-containing protein [Candidatus Aphodomonas sp.]
MPLKPREALLLRYYQNFSVEEIARILRVPRPTVYARLSRAKKLLNDALGGDWDG